MKSIEPHMDIYWWKKVALALLWVTVLYLVLRFLWPVAATLLNSFSTSSAKDQVIAALVGALFGALTTGLVTSFNDWRKERGARDLTRRLTHYNALIKLQWQSNMFRAVLEDNVFTINEIIEANDRGTLTPKRPQLIDIDQTHFEALYDIKLINMVNDFFYTARRLNLDASNLTRLMDELSSLYLSGQINQATYRLNVAPSRTSLIQIRRTIQEQLDNEVLNICAYVRICVGKDATWEMKRRFKRMTEGRKPITDSDVAGTRDAIRAELAEQEVASGGTAAH